MKKLFTFLSALVLMFGFGIEAGAQTDFEASSAPVNGAFVAGTKWYTIKFSGTGYYLTNATYNDTGFALNTTSQTTPAADDRNAQWCFVGNATSGYKIYNRAKGANYVLGFQGTTTANGGTYNLKFFADGGSEQTSFHLTSDHALGIQPGGSYKNMYLNPWKDNNVYSYVKHWKDSGGDGAMTFHYVDVEGATPITITITYMLGGNVVDTYTGEVLPGVAVSDIANEHIPDGVALSTGADAALNVTADKTSYTVNVVSIPFVAGRYTYAIRKSTDLTKYLTTTETTEGQDNYKVYKLTTTPEYFLLEGHSGAWKLKSTSTNKYVGSGGTGAAWWDVYNNSATTLSIVDVSGQTDVYTIHVNGNGNITSTQFIGWDSATDDRLYVNKSGSSLTYWNITKASMNVTVNCMNGETLVGTATGFVNFGETVEALASTITIPEGYSLPSEFETIADGKFVYTVNITSSTVAPERPTTTGAALESFYLKKGSTYLGITNEVGNNGINNLTEPQRWQVTVNSDNVRLQNLDAENTGHMKELYNGSSFSINTYSENNALRYNFKAYLIDTETGYGWSVTEFHAGSTYALVGCNRNKAMDNVKLTDGTGEGEYNKFMGVDYTAASGTTPAIFPEASWWTVEAPSLEITLNYTDENGTVTSVTKNASAGESVATLAAPYAGYTLGTCEPATVVAGTTEYTVNCVRHLTFTYRDELGNEFVTNTTGATYAAGATIPTTFDFYTLNEDETETTTVNTTTADYIIRLDNNFPFKVCPAPSETTGWDTQAAHSADYWFLLNTPTQYKDGAIEVPTRFMFRESSTRVRSDAFSRQLNENFLWAFVKVAGTQNHFRLYNLGEESAHNMDNGGYYLRKSTSSEETTFATDATGVSEFIVKKSTNTSHPKAFVMQDPNRVDAHLGRHTGGWDPNNKAGSNPTFGLWNHNSSADDEGSQLYVTPVVQLTDFDMDDAYSAADGYVGAYLNPENETTQACDTYKTDYKLADLRTLIATVGSDTNNARVEIAPNKYYQLISYNDANCEGMAVYSNAYRNADASSYGDRALLLCSQEDVSVPASAIQFVAEGTTGTYDIQHANSGFWFADLSQLNNGTTADLPVTRPGDGIAYFLNNEGGMVNVWSLHCTTNNARYFHCGNGPIDGVSTAICREDAPSSNNGTLWLIKEIKDVEVTISSAEWNSVCFPMPVVVPAEGCEVYVGQQIETNDHMTLTQLAAGTIIPEGTGFLVTGEAGAKSKFVVSETTGTAIDNLLEGVKARRTGMTAGDFYGLGQKNGTVGFYKSNTTAVPANKAYLPAANVPTGSGTQGIRFGKDDVTGIAPSMMTEPTATRYFDLQGRPVLFPSHGVYVTEDGKKVFIK